MFIKGLPPPVRGKVWRLALNNSLNLTTQLYSILRWAYSAYSAYSGEDNIVANMKRNEIRNALRWLSSFLQGQGQRVPRRVRSHCNWFPWMWAEPSLNLGSSRYPAHDEPMTEICHLVLLDALHVRSCHRRRAGPTTPRWGTCWAPTSATGRTSATCRACPSSPPSSFSTSRRLKLSSSLPTLWTVPYLRLFTG